LTICRLVVPLVVMHAIWSTVEEDTRKKSAAPFHITVPDLDKILRSVLDSLTGIVYKDDSQVDQIIARKAYALPDPGLEAVVIFTENE